MDPSTGRFITMDPYAGSILDPTSLHKYLYCNANPVMYSDPTGNSTNITEQQVAMAIIVILAAAWVIAEQSAMAQGGAILGDLRAQYNPANDFTLDTNRWQTGTSPYDFDYPGSIRDGIIERAVPKDDADEDTKDIAIPDVKKRNKPPMHTYFHATTAENAALIMESGVLKGSEMEGGYVFAWRLPPNKKALKLSGAKSAEVIIKFDTYSTFEDDWGIENKYVTRYGPVQSCFRGPIKISDPFIIPIPKN